MRGEAHSNSRKFRRFASRPGKYSYRGQSNRATVMRLITG